MTDNPNDCDVFVFPGRKDEPATAVPIDADTAFYWFQSIISTPLSPTGLPRTVGPEVDVLTTAWSIPSASLPRLSVPGSPRPRLHRGLVLSADFQALPGVTPLAGECRLHAGDMAGWFFAAPDQKPATILTPVPFALAFVRLASDAQILRVWLSLLHGAPQQMAELVAGTATPDLFGHRREAPAGLTRRHIMPLLEYGGPETRLAAITALSRVAR